ncbi:MAG TPA: DUF5990 family protein [Roseiflexaceae bacterium]|nr:DUF5990 family protein [Roseiflexaceae bacterium]
MVRRSVDVQKVQLIIDCLQPPVDQQDRATEFGLQNKQGVLLAGQPLAGGGLRFRCEADALVAGEDLDWRGVYIHGPRGDRFLYLAWRELAGNSWIRRCKVSLVDVRAADLVSVAQSVHTLLAEVPDIAHARARIVHGWRRVE